jgi:hypothetical protein
MQTLQTDPQAAWIFITDQLNTHQSETLVRLVAAQCDIQEDLGSLKVRLQSEQQYVR